MEERSAVLESTPSRTARTTFKAQFRSITMGKGDRKTAKGKRSIASYGNVRTHTAAKATGSMATPAVKKTTTKTAATKAPAKKVVSKKATS